MNEPSSSRSEHSHHGLYSLGEEIAHSVTHGLGVVASIVGLCVLVAFAALHGGATEIVAAAVFGSTLILLYTASTLYHSIPLPQTKSVLRVIDHASIYLLIAGTYTPFTLITLAGPWGWSLFGIVWGLAALGVAFKLFYTGRFEALSLIIYVAMGWCGVVAAQPLLDALPLPGLWLLLAGGLAYTGGVVFYAMKRLRYHHAIWHLFVLAGSVLHYFAVLLYVIPRA
ncbi:hemolysin III family protein [Algiphilus sp.]|uniref:PAQR family membrane homeostasis protein TrhA n=1 Tax=Algiphilus sp. TaxID=1872431 RepID=UPI001CA6BB57|nr:hemolysin III family protein [Algiphilus sp.]MBY8966342.1 hemolysin III family protein [Algiphilus acroporae]MCI5061901.1 hemolysin III family protein [Algiphilus sp.]MCI5102444.1 hemolysin III family protein [Algiphilus sp.]MCR9091001.1 hemolysin III family protein [Pseudomonadota bacterium]